jgi:hypothetical protein
LRRAKLKAKAKAKAKLKLKLKVKAKVRVRVKVALASHIGRSLQGLRLAVQRPRLATLRAAEPSGRVLKPRVATGGDWSSLHALCWRCSARD